MSDADKDALILCIWVDGCDFVLGQLPKCLCFYPKDVSVPETFVDPIPGFSLGILLNLITPENLAVIQSGSQILF